METQQTEYKALWKDEYLKWIYGFANAQGGVLSVGIDDKGQIIGVENAKKLLEDIPNKIAVAMGLIVDVNLKKGNEKEYLDIHIPVSSVPVAYHGKYYYRSGTTLQELSGIALQDFLMKKMRLTWEAQAIETATLDDIDPNAVKYFVDKGIAAKRLPPNAKNDSIDIVLKNRMLIDHQGRLTLAALLLFGKEPQRYCLTSGIKIGMFGIGYADLVSQDYVSGNLIQMADKVVEILDNKYLVRPIHYEGMQRIEPLEIPMDGLREILYNAIVHKDYRGPEITIRVSKEHIRITNEGPLPDGFTVETLLKKHESKRRNELIAQTFYYAGFIEAWGRGFEKIRESFGEENLRMPSFEENGRFFSVEIVREKYASLTGENHQSDTDVVDNVTKNFIDELTDRQKDILQYIQQCDIDDVTMIVTMNATMIAQHFNVSRRTIMRDIDFLVSKGLIKRVGSKMKGHWEIVSK